MAKEFGVGDELKRGVIRDRGCTDIFCLMLYFAFLAAMAYCCFLKILILWKGVFDRIFPK